MDTARKAPVDAHRISADPIGDVLVELRGITGLTGRPLPRKRLHTLGAVYEEHGPGGAEIYIRDAFDDNKSVQTGLLHALAIVRSHPAVVRNRTVGRYIFKTLDTIVNAEGGTGDE